MAGAGYKLFNTGDVLTAAQVNTYLMEQTVMVFANAAARTTALSGVVSEGMISYLKDTNAVEVYDGSNWVSSDDPNAIQNTIVDAKGDLIAASAADTPARLAVGNNGETLVADSSATTGLRWQGNYAAGKNKLINGDFNIWQRGTSVSITTTFQYLADRWQSIVGFGSPVGTMSQQAFTAGTAPVAGYESQYFLRLNLTTGPGGANPVAIGQRVEDVRTFAGQTVTLSFWAKADTTRSWYTRLIQNFGSGGSADVVTTGDTKTVTTSWQRITQTFTVPSISGKTIGAGNYLYVLIYGPDSVAQTMDIWGVQLEAGSVATAFQTATGTLAGELAACQRYYVRFNGEAANSSHAMGIAYGTTGCSVNYQLPVSMRIYPTAVEYSALRLTENVNAYNVTNLTLSTDKGTLTCINCTISVASGLTQFRSYLLTGVTSPNYVGFSAEL